MGQCSFVARISFYFLFRSFIAQNIVLHLKKYTSGALICFLLYFENPCHNIYYPVWGNLSLATYFFSIPSPVSLPEVMAPHFIQWIVTSQHLNHCYGPVLISRPIHMEYGFTHELTCQIESEGLESPFKNPLRLMNLCRCKVIV